MKISVLALLCGAALFMVGCSTTQKSEAATTNPHPASGKADSAPSKPAVAPPKSDTVAIQGTWKGETIQENPRHQCSFVATGKNFEFHDETDTNVWYKGTFTLKEDTNPRQFIAEVSDCPFAQYVGKTSMCIYRIEGDTLEIAGNEPGKPDAPTAFDSPEAAHIEVKKK